MKKITLSVFALSFGLVASLSAQEFSTQSGLVIDTTVGQVEFGGSCGGVLPNYENTSPSGNGGPSQSFEPVNAAFDCEMADDFVVPGSGQATVCQISIVGSYTQAPDPTALVILRLYEDAGGLPGNEIFFDFVNLATADPGFSGDITIETFEPPALNGGQKYWASVQLDMDFTPFGQFFWGTATDGNDDPYVFQNPGDGFATGCTSWGTGQSCGIAGGTGPDLMMSVSFEEFLSVSDFSNAQITAYPSPTSDLVYVRIPASLEVLEVSVFDLKGRNTGAVYSRGAVNLTGLSAGMYIISVKTSEGTLTQKVVKK